MKAPLRSLDVSTWLFSAILALVTLIPSPAHACGESGIYGATCGYSLTPGGQSWYSPSGRTTLQYHPDGNLVLYFVKNGNPVAIWSTQTNGKPAWKVFMQGDGNLVVYKAQGQPVWASNTPTSDRPQNVSLRLYDDGNMKIMWVNEQSLVTMWSAADQPNYCRFCLTSP